MTTENNLLDEQNPSTLDETEAPTPQRVARRMMALMAVSARGLIEPYSDEVDADVARLDILTWLDQLNLWDEFEPEEERLLQSAVGTLEPPEDIDAAWRMEAVAVLAWALGLYELAPYDQPVHVGELREVVSFLDSKAQKVIDDAKLRSAEELDAFGDQIFAIHWRLNHFYMVSRSPIEFEKVAHNSRFGDLDLGMARLLEGDLAIRENPIAKCLDEERHICNGIVVERHRASNWLAGYDPVYSQVDIST